MRQLYKIHSCRIFLQEKTKEQKNGLRSFYIRFTNSRRWILHNAFKVVIVDRRSIKTKMEKVRFHV